MKKYWREVLLGSIVVLIIIPLIIAYMMSFSLIETDTNNVWIGFWGSYLGAIVGGVISGCVAMYVLVKTLQDNKRMQRREEIIYFCDRLVRKSGEFAQKYQSTFYKMHDYMAYKENLKPSESAFDSYKEFLEPLHSGKIVLYEILQHLEIRKDISLFSTSNAALVTKSVSETYAKFSEMETIVAKAEKMQDIDEEKLISIMEDSLGLLAIYEKELLNKVVD